MGSSYPLSRNERIQLEWAADQRIKQQEKDKVAKRMELADKIVLALVDSISSNIIRPGPDAAERECYVVAQELREHSPMLRELVSRILKIEEEED